METCFACARDSNGVGIDGGGGVVERGSLRGGGLGVLTRVVGGVRIDRCRMLRVRDTAACHHRPQSVPVPVGIYT